MEINTVTDAEVAAFNEKRRRDREERLRVDALVEMYRKSMPKITAHWDTSANAVDYNDILADCLKEGVSIYSCSMDQLWQGIFDPVIFEVNTLWSRKHNSGKIAKIIEAWESGRALSPILISQRGATAFAVVNDGNHRLTVSRAINAVDMPFMVLGDGPAWVSKVFPSAKRII